MDKVPNGEEELPKNLNRLYEYGARTLQTKDGRAIAYSEPEHEFTFAKTIHTSLSELLSCIVD